MAPPAITVLLIAVTISFGLVSTSSYGEQPAEVSERESLKGLVGVEVLVEPFAIEIEELGLNTPRLHSEIKQRLQKAGISVLTERERLATPTAAMLVVRVDALHDRIGRYFYSTELFLTQRVRLEGNEVSELFAATWRKPGTVGVVADDNVKHLEDQVLRKVDQFIKDYLAVNPDRSKNNRRLRKP
ncbi:MAG: hypothetical protein HY038_09690 [Nitrospirae bacterium]|nr:hypothetical protein [Nitrospirota bacterium]